MLRNLLFLACGAGLFLLGAQWFLRPAPNRLANSESPANRGGLPLIVDQVDAEFQLAWENDRLDPAPSALDAPDGDLLVMRRIALGLMGTVPSLEEIRAFEQLPPEQRIDRWIDTVLADRRYADYVAERLARAYVGTDNGPFLVFRRRRFVLWLSEQLSENRPYDAIVREVIAGRGLWTDSPGVNFITATIDQDGTKRPDPEKLAGRVTRAFLGLRLDCVRCHDDNLGGPWLQQDFHELAAFFSEVESSALGVRDQPQPYAYQFLGAEEEVEVNPGVPFDPDLLEKVRAAEQAAAPPDQPPTRRDLLAAWVTHPENPHFARATVNRVWAIVNGRPLVEPVDELPLEGPYPPGLETLARDFAAHGYDLRRLIRAIVATEAFQRDSRAAFEITSEHEARWAAFPLTRLRPEQVCGALIQSSSLHTIDADSNVIVRLSRSGQELEFVKRYGDVGEDEFTGRGGTIPQRLLLMNGKLVRERTKDDMVQNAATNIAALAPDDKTAVETAYLAVLTRRPTERELAHFQERLVGSQGNARVLLLQDLYWTLLNSTEFSWNH